MFCQECHSEMIQVEKYGVIIETCKTFGGVWLRKGELRNLMTRATQAGSSVDEELSRAQPRVLIMAGPILTRGVVVTTMTMTTTMTTNTESGLYGHL
jgi:hypothetical protein